MSFWFVTHCCRPASSTTLRKVKQQSKLFTFVAFYSTPNQRCRLLLPPYQASQMYCWRRRLRRSAVRPFAGMVPPQSPVMRQLRISLHSRNLVGRKYRHNEVSTPRSSQNFLPSFPTVSIFGYHSLNLFIGHCISQKRPTIHSMHYRRCLSLL